MSDNYADATELPASHPLAGYEGSLEDHADHVEALAEYLNETPSQELDSVMLIVTANDATDTIPTMREDIATEEFEEVAFHQLAAHISHVASAYDADPFGVAQHACHLLGNRDGGDEV